MINGNISSQKSTYDYLYTAQFLRIFCINDKIDKTREWFQFSIQFNIFIVSKIADPRARIIVTKILTK